MSNKTTITKVAGFFKRTGIRISNFVHYKMLSNKKSLLMIGGDDLPEFRNALINRYSSNWKILSIASTQVKSDVHVPLTQLTTQQYTSIQAQALKFTKLFDSIVVLPTKKSEVTFSDPNIIDNFLSKQFNKVDQSILAYKLASKMLTPHGVLIFTGSQKSFFGQKQTDAVTAIITGQNSCLNTIAGERDYTDVNSCNLLALTDDYNLQDQQNIKQVVQLIKSWSEGSQLPYPGSFAKILIKNQIYYPEFF